MKIELEGYEIKHPGGLEIAIRGFAGDYGAKPTQVFIELYEGELRVHVWDGTSEDPKSHTIRELDANDISDAATNRVLEGKR